MRQGEDPGSPEQLRESHSPDAIRERMNEGAAHPYLRDFVFGAIDGTVTTFAVVAGVEGAGLAAGVTLALGVANLLADGFSMATGNYLSTRTETERLEHTRRKEELHIDTVPEGEREEIRQIYAAKGFADPLLEQIVQVITEDRRRWVDTMLVEEHGLSLVPPSPLKAAMVTFLAFAIAGAVPLLPFALGLVAPEARFPVASGLMAVEFLAIGWLKGYVLMKNRLVAALETLALGGIAALLAYGAGHLFRAG